MDDIKNQELIDTINSKMSSLKELNIVSDSTLKDLICSLSDVVKDISDLVGSKLIKNLLLLVAKILGTICYLIPGQNESVNKDKEI